MIKNIPTEEELLSACKELLDTAWEVVAALLRTLDEAKTYLSTVAERDVEEYWLSAKRQLTTSLSIVQQAVELGLKGKIAAISPFLLIGDPPQKWPKEVTAGNGDFLKLRTIDAQDLVRVHNTFAKVPLQQVFVDRFNELREKRNIIVHTSGDKISVKVMDVIDSILFMHKHFFPTEHWGVNRLAFLDAAPGVSLWGDDYSVNTVSHEVGILLDTLSRSQVKSYFDIDKRARRYRCPNCFDNACRDVDFEDKLAVLELSAATPDRLRCPACNQTSEVIRKKCTCAGCKGNVISQEHQCLTCGVYQD